jgi:hypothetical protein
MVRVCVILGQVNPSLARSAGQGLQSGRLCGLARGIAVPA